jgi:hypothetical protein
MSQPLSGGDITKKIRNTDPLKSIDQWKLLLLIVLWFGNNSEKMVLLTVMDYNSNMHSAVSTKKYNHLSLKTKRLWFIQF